jgi:large subunit ribosomal protein L4
MGADDSEAAGARIKALREGSLTEETVAPGALARVGHPVVLREAVLMYEANRRVGTASTRTRRFVSGTTRKWYKQKHTGRARHGDKKAPIFRGGGVAHGPHPRDHSWQMPRKALRGALRAALAGKLRDGEIVRWGPPTLDAPSARGVRRALDVLGKGDAALILAAGPVDRNLLLSVRNLRRVRALPAAEATAHDVLAHRWVVLLDGAWEALQTRLAPADRGDAS